MAAHSSLPSAVRNAVRRLRPILGDRLVTTSDPGYESTRRLWNAAVTTRPAVIARCLDADDVRTVVRTARDCGVPLSVRAGGHDWAGRALRPGGLALDLTGMNQVTVARDSATAIVAGGATAADLLAAAQPYGLVTATGVVRAVGMAGLTMAGGYGPLCGRYGLALDNLLGAELVLADGQQVTASPDDDAELYWALRGGGGNFGVVTSLRYRLHPLRTVLAGMILFPVEQARSVLASYRNFLPRCPDELTVMAGFLPGPQGQPVLFLAPSWSGRDLGAGERAVARLVAFGRPVTAQVGPMPYGDALGMFDGGMLPGNQYLLRTRWLADLSEPAVEVLLDAATEASSPYSALAVHHFHGAATRVGRTETAFGLRHDHLLVEVIAVWPPGEPVAAHRHWADRCSARLAPFALPGGYPNLLAPDEPERIRLAYGPNYPRLLAAKRRYDPDNVFGSAVPTLPRISGPRARTRSIG
ncbi:FAD-binding oxidoreductase [Plantactinospora sp. S1510]|uniref:FAD-binding oxidoreductase n=1 Tax=Plantactinospora alkalitolerans TaxID=2789879 RepID=A0ABS0H5V2_9ACTN|nr:FAD-binding oxidoreductase [Plantactinospora alkalitolerans]MBF9133841.1 FAD-binding oxidoreductase [Plantactinospora alkalitolerans]